VAALSSSDRKAALAILENAQWVYALSRYPKKQVLDDAVDVRMLRDRVAATRTAARSLSAAQKKKLDVPWDKLDDEGDDEPDALWDVAKKVTPKIIASLRPLVVDTPEAAFLIDPQAKKATGRVPTKKRAATRKRRK
jgi:hypothetical protein